MFKLLWSVALPCIIAGWVLYEGLSTSYFLLNLPNDGAFSLGVLGIAGTLALAASIVTAVFSHLINDLEKKGL